MTTFTREDFAHAARAVGKHSVEWAEPGQINDKGGLVQYVGLGRVETWNPPDDDGDALRLARHLRMTIADDPMKTCWSVGAVVNGQFTWLASSEDQRHAIFCAAIAIGKATP